MSLKDNLKLSRKTFFNPSGWFSYNEVSRNIKTTWDTSKDLFVIEKSTREESFEQALQRLKLTETDVKRIREDYLIYTWMFLGLAVVTVLVSFYLLFQYETLSGLILGLATTALFLTQAFRYHFWHFQMKFRKLGCTLQEWRRGKPFEPEEPK